jgi:hypothetical protein
MKILIFLLSFYAYSIIAQIRNSSKLYNSKGELIANPKFKITKDQYKKWVKVEDTLTNSILKKVEYPQFNFEAGLEGKLIFSFVLDEKGEFSSFKLESDTTKYSKDSLNEYIKPLKLSSMWATKCYSREFASNGFKSKRKKEKYYFPFDFKVNQRADLKSIINGWMTIDLGVNIKVYEKVN